MLLMISRSFSGGGDLGSAIRGPNPKPFGPFSERPNGAGPPVKNPLVLGEKSAGGSSGASRTKRSVVTVDEPLPKRRRLDSDLSCLHVGAIGRSLCPRGKGRGDRLRLCESDFDGPLLSVE
jgi:hypothetical protein